MLIQRAPKWFLQKLDKYYPKDIQNGKHGKQTSKLVVDLRFCVPASQMANTLLVNELTDE